MKKVLYVVIGLLLIYLILCLFGPSKITVERSIVINAPAENIRAAFTDFKFFKENWSPWSEKDPNMTSVYEGETGKPGSKYSWVGNKDVGSGTMELLSVDDTIMQKLVFTEPQSAEGSAWFYTKAEEGGVKATWGMSFNVGFLGRAPMLFMNMEKMMSPDFEKGLAKLKAVMEAMPATVKMYNGYEVKELMWEEKTYCGTPKTKMTAAQLPAFFGKNYPKMGGDLKSNKIEMMGAPSAIYFSWDDKTMETECAAVIGVANGTKVKGWEIYSVPASKILHIAYLGAYDKVMIAHAGMDEYMKEKGLTQTMVIEEYANDPMVEKDTAKWLTNIYYVIK